MPLLSEQTSNFCFIQNKKWKIEIIRVNRRIQRSFPLLLSIFLLFLTPSINYSRVSSIRNIRESRSKSIQNLSNPIEKLRVPNLDDSSSSCCNGDASKLPTSRSTFSTLSRRSVIVSAIRFRGPISWPFYRVARPFKNFVTFFHEVEMTRIPPPAKSLISG